MILKLIEKCGFELVPDIKKKFPKLWSVRMNVLAGLFSGVELILPMFESSFPRGAFASLGLFFTAAALISRALAQKELNGDE